MELPNNRDKNQIDHVIIDGRWKRLFLDTRTFRGAYANSDHNFVVAKLRLKLKKTANSKSTSRKVINIKRQYSEEVKEKFCLEIRNIFKALEDLKQDDELSLE